MNKWIISIVGIVLISSIIVLILPEGKLAKYIKGIFGVIIVFVIIEPVFTLKNSNFDVYFENNTSEVVLQKNYLDFIGNEKVYYLQENCSKILLQNGFKNVVVLIEYTNDEQGQTNIKKAIINLKNAVFIYDYRHIDIIDDIIKPVSEYLNIDEKQVDVIE